MLVSKRGAMIVAAVTLNGIAGVQVQSPTSLTRWSLATTPTVLLGDGSSAAEEFDRITDAVRTPTGEIVVGDGATRELRVFSAAGAHLRTLSRSGEGPGEFRSLGPMSAAGDSLYVIERPPGPSLLHLFTASAGFVRRVRLRATNDRVGFSGIARLANGALLVSRGGMRVVTPPPVGALARDSMTLGLLDPAKESVLWLGTFPGNTWLGYALPPGSAAVSQSLTRFPFGSSIVYAAAGNRVWIGNSENGVIQIFDAMGEPVGTTQAPVRARQLSREALEQSRSQTLASAMDPVAKARISAVYSQAARGGAAPYFSRFVPGPNDELWIESFQEAESAQTAVIVLDRAGAPLATLDLPPRATLLQAGTDYVLVMQRDRDDLETVAMYQVRRR